ncbi:hypothetical protein [Streptomyces tendae]|uniref:hypothetical protein n=1 Tax=Streptomyces tendae TaxID=1932 RepID=UPI0036950D60
MTTTEWITDIALVLVVFRQLREGRLDQSFSAMPRLDRPWPIRVRTSRSRVRPGGGPPP